VAAEKEIAEMNLELEPIIRQEWELTTGMRRMGLRNRGGPKPTWKWTVANGKLARKSTGGIDWYRYRTVILLPKLFPFAKECLKDRPNTVVQEDNAPSHAHVIQQQLYQVHDIQKLFWCANSPDLNMIEPCWPLMKRQTTKKGAPTSRQEAIQAWQKAWKDLSQEQIQAWIERMPRHIEEVIRLEGGNEYKEGRRKPDM
jgi:hypothetical protein